MMFRAAILTAVLAATATANDDPPTLCYDYSSLDLNLTENNCNSRTIFRKIRDIFTAERKEKGGKCKGGAKRELMALTGTTNFDAAEDVLDEMCKAQKAIGATQLGSGSLDIGVDLEEYFKGRGFLNTETGNFQQKESEFLKRGADKFITISTDPRINDHYPTTEESYSAGQAVYDTYENDAKTSFFSAPTGRFSQGCETNTAMCCFSRDRQYFDKNGGCTHADCAHENPGDNTDLCWTKGADDEVFPYPGDVTEKDLHCHGISWSGDDESGEDINSMARWNSLFYVSLYDHMYTRGYVESITSDPLIQGEQAMCGCIEDMAPVARADCNQVVGKMNYTATVDVDRIVVEGVPGSFELEFEACEGYEYVEDVGPEDLGEVKLKSSNNDLAAFVFRQYLEGKLNEGKVELIEETLIGYRNPSVNKNDKNREEACQAAFEDRYPGVAYEEKVLEESVEGEDVLARKRKYLR